MDDLTLVDIHPEGRRRYGFYTLVCSTLLDYRDDIEEVLSDLDPDLQSQVATAVEQLIPNALNEVLHGGLPTLEEGITRLTNLIEARRPFVADHHAAGELALNRFVDRLTDQAATWSYIDDVDRWHQIGRAMARDFYRDSPYPAQEQALNRNVTLEVIYLNLSSEGYPLADQRGTGDERVVRLYFALDNEYEHYLRYPFLFLHEYVSHVYMINKGSERFEDGWLYYAAEQYFAHHAAEYGVLGPQRCLDHPKTEFTAPARYGHADAERLWSEFLGRINDLSFVERLSIFHRVLHGLGAVPSAIPGRLHSLLRSMKGNRERLREFLVQSKGDLVALQSLLEID